MEQVVVKQWIINKNLSNEEAQVVGMVNNRGYVEKETEKAVFVVFDTKLGKVKSWFPKSQVSEIEEGAGSECTTLEALEFAIQNGFATDIAYEDYKKECEAKGIENKFEKGLKYNEYLKSLCFENKLIKTVKRKMCTSTLIEKLENAHIEYQTKAEFFVA